MPCRLTTGNGCKQIRAVRIEELVKRNWLSHITSPRIDSIITDAEGNFCKSGPLAQVSTLSYLGGSYVTIKEELHAGCIVPSVGIHR